MCSTGLNGKERRGLEKKGQNRLIELMEYPNELQDRRRKLEEKNRTMEGE